MRIPVYDKNGHKTPKWVEIDDLLFGEKINRPLLKEAILMYEACQRSGTHETKTRSFTSGSGKKPWRQKGTGRARCGSTRSPIWRGGGTTFGPHPRDYSYSIPKQAKRSALNSAWKAKLQDHEVVVIEQFEFAEPNTKKASTILKNMGLAKIKTLIGIAEHDPVLWKSLRNIPTVSLQAMTHFNPYLLLSHPKIVLSQKALESLISGHGGEVKYVDLNSAKGADQTV